MLEHVLRAASHAVSPALPITPLSQGSSDLPSAAQSANAPDAEDGSSPQLVVILGHERAEVQRSILWTPPEGEITYLVQEPQLGTGDAVRTAHAAWPESIGDSAPSTILVLYGDTPLLQSQTLTSLLEEHFRSRATLSFLTSWADDPGGYGRVVRNTEGLVQDIVEERHADASQVSIHEINSGVYCFEAGWLWPHLDLLSAHPNGEYYLTDLVGMAVRDGKVVSTSSASADETMGINDRTQLAAAERIMRQRVLRDLMLSGVTVEDPDTTYVDAGVQVGQDSILRPGTILRGATVIGESCEIGPNSFIRDSSIGDGCLVLASWLESAVMESGSRIGPMSRLRAGAHLLRGAHVGNFGEVKNATIGSDVQMHHFSYVGDATIGTATNIGAGAITMNYDGKEKHHTEIGDRVFIGCDTLLRAPVVVGADAVTGAGSVVTRDVPPGTLAIGMPAQIRQRTQAGGDAPSSPANGTGLRDNSGTRRYEETE
jgi:bifunctional UDP-N-acetylglucosamine pyrophosphorylase/glucosamine-1-phosphate N-acetyltransferase